jgi:EmrB/QacA subfamily drug resistance transporter
LSVTSVGTVMSGIDARILIVGLPTVARALGADVNQVIWVSQSYLLASTVGLLLIGRVTDIVGRVKIYNIGFAVFTVGSLLASLSFSPDQLIAYRVVQGVGSAMLITNSAAILTDATPIGELGTILGLNTVAFRAGSVLALTISGLILTIASWRALFYINIPIGIFGTIWAYKKLREISTKDKSTKMDWPGFFTFTSGLTLILVSMTFYSYGVVIDYTFGSIAMIVGAILLVVFARIEQKSDAPLLDLSLFKIRSFAAGNIAQLFNGLAWTGFIVMLSFYLQLVLGYSPLLAGLSILPFDAGFLLSGPLSGRFSDRYGPRIFSAIGLAISSAGLLLLTFLNMDSGFGLVAVVLVLEGIGNGMFVSPNISAIMGSVPPNRRGVASGFRNTIGNIALTASAGLVVLLISSGIPYGVFTQFIEGVSLHGLQLVAARAQFVAGFRFASLVFAIFNAAGIIPAALETKQVYAETRVERQSAEASELPEL